MTAFVFRPFRRSDRDQVVRLVNAHCAAVLPGSVVSVNTLLSQFECEPGEFIVDPWVAERVPLVAEQQGSIVAAALLVRYRNDPDVGDSLRGAGEVRWLVFWPLAPSGNEHWKDGHAAADALAAACIDKLASWHCVRQLAEGGLPVPGVYGVPEQWPHVAALLLRHGFVPQRTETVLLADLHGLAAAGGPTRPGLTVRRSVGINGTRCSAMLDAQRCAYIEIHRLDQPDRRPGAALADIGNLWVDENHRRQGIGSHLLRYASQWLLKGGAQHLLAYATPDETELIAFLEHSGFEVATVTQLGWVRAINTD